jgi:nitrogen fixation/metabolism regulation signal transduction histidine kinase
MMRSLSLKMKTFGLLLFVVLLATIPMMVYYVNSFRALAHLGTDPLIEATLAASVPHAASEAERGNAALSLKKYRQIEVLKESIIRQVMLVSMFYFLAVVLIALIVGYFFISRITRPLKDLTDATAKLAADDLEVTLPESEGGEIGRLIRSFNTMARNLNTARQEKLIAERKATWQRVARVIAHEIKNPLTPIKLSTERLYEKYLTQSKDFGTVIKSTTDTILNEISTLQRLVDTFHKYAKFPDPVLKPEPLNAIVKEVCGMFGTSGAPITCTCDSSIAQVNMDKGQIREALGNLLKNACESIAESGRPGEIRVSMQCVDGRVAITVRDSGCGIAPENMGKLFQPYFTTKKAGNGIGLALTERIISLHGGTIICRSEADKGAEFVITLPR